MPKRTKRIKTRSKPKLSWKILFASFAPVLLIVFILLRSGNGQNVLGTNDTSQKAGTYCQQVMFSAISSITFSGPCNLKGNPGFKSVKFTCSDGTSGGSSGNCLSPQNAIEKAGKTCSKNSKCATVTPGISREPKPSGSVLPTRFPRPSEKPEPSRINRTGSTR